MKHRIATRVASLLLVVVAAVGCGSESENLSTRSTDDPARFEAAQADTEAARQKAEAAEAAAFGDALSGIEEP